MQKFVDSVPVLVDHQALGLGWASTGERGPGTLTVVFAADSPQAAIDAIVKRLALGMPDLIHPAAPTLNLQESSVDENVAILGFGSPDAVNLQYLRGDLLLREIG